MRLIKKLRSVNSRIPLKFKVWMYFILFTIVVFVLLWTFQILFLEKFYEGMKVRDAAAAAKKISASYDTMEKQEFRSLLSEVAVENDLCVEVLDKYGRSVYSEDVLGDCLIHGRENYTSVYVTDIINSSDKEIRYRIVNPRTHYNMLLYGCVLGDSDRPEGYLLLNSALVPVGSTVSIIKRQLMIITALLIIMAFIISLFLSRRIGLSQG